MAFHCTTSGLGQSFHIQALVCRWVGIEVGVRSGAGKALGRITEKGDHQTFEAISSELRVATGMSGAASWWPSEASPRRATKTRRDGELGQRSGSERVSTARVGAGCATTCCVNRPREPRPQQPRTGRESRECRVTRTGERDPARRGTRMELPLEPGGPSRDRRSERGLHCACGSRGRHHMPA